VKKVAPFIFPGGQERDLSTSVDETDGGRDLAGRNSLNESPEFLDLPLCRSYYESDGTREHGIKIC
jgi:hypothetical protein